MKVYKIRFSIQVLCCGVISYTEGHVTVLATSEEEAKKKVRENIQLNYNGAITINQIVF